jgi:hypothetical protein
MRIAATFVPPAQTTPPAFQYIDRSTTMPTPLVTWTTAPNDSSASSGTAALTWMLWRLVGATTWLRTIVVPSVLRYVMVTLAALAAGFASRM